MNRRRFLGMAAGAAVAVPMLSSCGRSVQDLPRRIIVMAVDGMDPGMVERLASDGRLPNIRALSATGGYSRLATALPPQSPVAWSSFITGKGPGVHGIFDFVHRNPRDRSAYLSTSVVEPGGRTVDAGRWRIPLRGAHPRLLRRGDPFWKPLTDAGIPVSLMNLPVDFPPDSAHGARVLTGLGTPDVTGSQGSFSFYTDDPMQISDDTGGGIVSAVRDDGTGTYRFRIYGPRNTFLENAPQACVEASLAVDRASGGALIEVPGDRLVLAVGEWSRWVRIRFDLVPGIASVAAIGRFCLCSVEPALELYLSPLQMDPIDPAMPISSPGWLSRDLAIELGTFSTKGFPEDTKALSRGVLSDAEYIDQALLVLEEQERLFRHGLNEFRDGLAFHYFTSLDLNMHVFYRAMDFLSPAPRVSAGAAGFIPYLYDRIDSLVGEAMDLLDSRTDLLVISDHGFAPFRRQFDLNTWLAASGYMSRDRRTPSRAFFEGVDWNGTAAYGLGINSLYLNLRGREEGGSVDPSEAYGLLAGLKADLESVTDPLTGRRVVSCAHIVADEMPGPVPDHAPDIIVGYAPGYRSSWATALGGFGGDVLSDNTDAWSGDHCMEPSTVPGVIAASCGITVGDPALSEVGVSAAALILGTGPEGRQILS